MIIDFNRESRTITHNGCACCESYPTVIGDDEAIDENELKCGTTYIRLSDLAKQLNKDAHLTAECAAFFGLECNLKTGRWQVPAKGHVDAENEATEA